MNLSCEATGIPTPVITWYKDGLLVSKEKVKEVKGNSLLTLEYVRSHDQGEYWCEAQSAEGWNRSRTSLNSTSLFIFYFLNKLFLSFPNPMIALFF